MPVALQLFLPDEWTGDVGRCVQAGVPEDQVALRIKSEIALAELDCMRATEARFGTVLADAGYDTSTAFRHALDARGMRWAVVS